MYRYILKDRPSNVCGDNIYFWIEGNTSEAFTKIDENFNYLGEEAHKAKKLLTYARWSTHSQEMGYATFSFPVGGDDYQVIFVKPDGTILTSPEEMGLYKGAKFTALNDEEMQYIRSKVLVSPDAVNIVEYRYFNELEGRILPFIQPYYLNTKTKKLREGWIEDFSPEENAFMLDLRFAGPNVVFSNQIRPLTQEEMKDFKAKAKQKDDEAIQLSQNKGLVLPKLETEYAKIVREEYLQKCEDEAE